MWEVLRFDMNFLYTMINLIVLAFLLKKFLIKPVTDIMEKRRQLIEDGLKNAQNAHRNRIGWSDHPRDILPLYQRYDRRSC